MEISVHTCQDFIPFLSCGFETPYNREHNEQMALNQKNSHRVKFLELKMTTHTVTVA